MPLAMDLTPPKLASDSFRPRASTPSEHTCHGKSGSRLLLRLPAAVQDELAYRQDAGLVGGQVENGVTHVVDTGPPNLPSHAHDGIDW